MRKEIGNNSNLRCGKTERERIGRRSERFERKLCDSTAKKIFELTTIKGIGLKKKLNWMEIAEIIRCELGGIRSRRKEI